MIVRILKRTGLVFAVVSILSIMIGPLIVVVLASFTTTSYVTFPPAGFTLRWYSEAFSNTQMMASLSYSVWVAFFAAILSTLLAFTLALALEAVGRGLADRRIHKLIAGSARSYSLLPMMIPSVIIAVALLVYFTKLGFGSSPFALVLAYAVDYFPFVFLMIEVGLSNAPDSLRRSAEILGANSYKVLRHITAPLAAPGIAAGFALAFVLSFSEVTIGVFLQRPGTVTLPVYLYNKLYAQPPTPDLTAISAAVTLGTVLVIAAVMFILSRDGKDLLRK